MTDLEVIFGLVAILGWATFEVVDTLEAHLPLRARTALGKVDLDDPRTVEEIRESYARGRITEAEMERRLEVAVDPRTEQIQRAVQPVSGIGPETSLAIAAAFESEGELREASREDLEDVANVGPKRAEAILERL